MSGSLIAVLDIGKTNTKLLVLDEQSGDVLWSRERPSAPRMDGPARTLDLEGIEVWLRGALSAAPGRERVRAIVPITHGAAAVLLDQNGHILYAPDYEDPLFDTIADAYRAERDPFELTYSPFLPQGLNLGRQWFYLKQHAPQVFARVHTALLYPQYWAWRLSAVAASERTSLGCHSDLWHPRRAEYSKLARRHGWSTWLPPLRSAGDALGLIRPEIAQSTGLPPSCQILCGIHDSNASYLTYLMGRGAEEPFTVVSSGTWTVLLAHGADLDRLHEQQGMLANVDAFGTPVATARFMGGREFAAIAGAEAASAMPDWSDVGRLLDGTCFAVPSFAPGGGPFATHAGRMEGVEGLNHAERVALATLYLALMTDLLAESLGAKGQFIVDGPLAANPLFGPLLAALGSQRPVLLASERSGLVQAARLLCGSTIPKGESLCSRAKISRQKLLHYREQWRLRLPARD